MGNLVRCLKKGGIKVKFGERIKERRLSIGMTLTELAKQIGISKPFLSDVERSNRLMANVTTFYKLCEVLQLDESKSMELLFQLAKERNNIEFELIVYYREREYKEGKNE